MLRLTRPHSQDMLSFMGMLNQFAIHQISKAVLTKPSDLDNAISNFDKGKDLKDEGRNMIDEWI